MIDGGLLEYYISRGEKIPPRDESGTRPMPGDAVRLTDRWRWGMIGPNRVGIIDGMVGHPDDKLEITFNYSCFRGPSSGSGPEIVSCSGGPGTIALDYRNLKKTGRKFAVSCWKWKDYPRAGGGEPYMIEVDEWEWNGNEEY